MEAAGRCVQLLQGSDKPLEVKGAEFLSPPEGPGQQVGCPIYPQFWVSTGFWNRTPHGYGDMPVLRSNVSNSLFRLFYFKYRHPQYLQISILPMPHYLCLCRLHFPEATKFLAWQQTANNAVSKKLITRWKQPACSLERRLKVNRKQEVNVPFRLPSRLLVCSSGFLLTALVQAKHLVTLGGM